MPLIPLARTRARRLLRGAGAILFVAGLMAWAVLFRPTALGGSATYVIVSGDSMLPTYRPGDLVIAQPAPEYPPGAVVVFRIPPGEPGAGRLVIHRIVSADAAARLTTRGDHNAYTDPWHPSGADIVGTPAHVVPGVGPVIGLLRTPIVAAAIAAAVAMVWLASTARGVRPGEGPRQPQGAAV